MEVTVKESPTEIVIIISGVNEKITDIRVDLNNDNTNKKTTPIQTKEPSQKAIKIEEIQRLISKPSNTLSKKQRELVKSARILKKEETKMSRIIGKAQALKQEGKKWREVYNTLHIARLTNEQREILKAHLGTF